MPQPLTAEGKIDETGKWEVCVEKKWESDDKKTSVSMEASVEGNKDKVDDKKAEISFKHEF